MVRAPTVKLPLTLAGGGLVEIESQPYDLNISKQSVVANSWGDKKNMMIQGNNILNLRSSFSRRQGVTAVCSSEDYIFPLLLL